MKSRESWMWAAGVVGLMVSGAKAQGPMGGLPGYFFNQGSGARALGMGKAFVAVADDISVINSNPAGLFAIQRSELSFMHIQLFEETRYDFMGYVHGDVAWEPFAWGVGVAQLYTDGLVVRDALNNPTGTFSDRQSAAWLSVGWLVDRNSTFSIGVSLKYYMKQLDVASASTIDADTGFMWMPIKNTRLGLTIRNIMGSQLAREGGNEQLPWIVLGGVAFIIPEMGITVAGAVEQVKDNAMTWHGSVEYAVLSQWAVRAGYDQGQLVAGMGFRQEWLGLDYAVVTHTDLGMSHRASLSFQFGESRNDIHSRQRLVELLASGEKAIQAQSWVEAKQWIQSALAVNPKHDRALLKLEQINRALDNRTRLLDLVKAGEAHLKSSQWRDWSIASQEFNMVISEDGRIPGALAGLKAAKEKLKSVNPSVTVLDLEAKSTSPSVAVVFTDSLTNVLGQSKRFSVTNRSKVEEAMKGRAPCSTVEGAVEIGKLFNSQFVIMGNVGEVGETYTLSFVVIDMESLQTVFSKVVNCPPGVELRKTCSEFVKAFSLSLLGE